MKNRIFSTDSAKAVKAQLYGYLNAIHYLAPADLSGTNLCPHASEGCRRLCLGWTAGQAGMVSDVVKGMNSVRQSRIDKARRFMRERAAYLGDIVQSIETLIRRAARSGNRLCVRMNGSSDIAWEGVACERNGEKYRNLFEAFKELDFVDYTKNPRRFERTLPRNYHLTFSRSESNEAQAIALLGKGVNVAVVFEHKPASWQGFDCIDGDQHDLRQLDPRGARGVVIALTPKGRVAKKDHSGFVVR